MSTYIGGDKKLMTAVLAQVMTDYIQAVKVGGLDFSKKLKKEIAKISKAKKKNCDLKKLRKIELMTRGENAKCYIFDDSDESRGYVFGFEFICTYIGLDPGRLRKRIKEKREEFWKDIYAK